MKLLVALCIVCVVLSPTVLGSKNNKPIKPSDVCTFDCMTDLYNEFCGGATCVHGVENERQREAMCSDKCLDVILGQPGAKCIEKNFPGGSDVEDFIDFLRIGINDFCFDGDIPLEDEEAQSSEEAELREYYEQRGLDLVDGDEAN